MGSFSFTCAVSGLPIEAGDAVRYTLVVEYPYEDANGCYMHEAWYPRCWPIRAAYNDYGSVEDVEGVRDGELSGQLRAWFDAFRRDLVEVGWGENSVHDVPVSKEMSWDAFLVALHEHRVRVYARVPSDVAWPPRTETVEERERYLSPGIPTIRRITRALEAAGLPIYAGAGDGYMVDDEEGWGCIRVRWHSYGSSGMEYVEVAAKVLSENYATMVTHGTGDYARSADLLVRPKPGTEGYSSRRKSEAGRLLAVRQMMIREDVWQKLCSMSLEGGWGLPKNVRVDFFRQKAREAWNTLVPPVVPDRSHLSPGLQERLAMAVG